MKSSELDVGVAAPVESVPDLSFPADVFVVDWEVAVDPPAGAPWSEHWRRNEGVSMSRDGA